MTDAITDQLDDFAEVYAAMDDYLRDVPIGEQAIAAAVLVVAARLDWIGRELHAAAHPEEPS